MVTGLRIEDDDYLLKEPQLHSIGGLTLGSESLLLFSDFNDPFDRVHFEFATGDTHPFRRLDAPGLIFETVEFGGQSFR